MSRLRTPTSLEGPCCQHEVRGACGYEALPMPPVARSCELDLPCDSDMSRT